MSLYINRSSKYIPYEKQYMSHLKNILETGSYELNERTGKYTYRLPCLTMTIDLQKEFAILKSKHVYWDSAMEEILWIAQQQSNNIKNLRPHIWDKWADKDGSIGKAYGYQVSKPVNIKGKDYKNQVAYVLESLADDSSDRECVINLWDVEDLGDMNLVPCCYTSVWNIIDGKLNCMLTQRSGDFPVGVPFNTTQYAGLVHLFANHLGVYPGTLTHCISDAHIYEDQVEGVKEQLSNWVLMNNNWNQCLPDKYKIAQSCRPKFVVENLDFWNVKIENIRIEDYYDCGVIKYPVTE